MNRSPLAGSLTERCGVHKRSTAPCSVYHQDQQVKASLHHAAHSPCPPLCSPHPGECLTWRIHTLEIQLQLSQTLQRGQTPTQCRRCVGADAIVCSRPTHWTVSNLCVCARHPTRIARPNAYADAATKAANSRRKSIHQFPTENAGRTM